MREEIRCLKSLQVGLICTFFLLSHASVLLNATLKLAAIFKRSPAVAVLITFIGIPILISPSLCALYAFPG